MKTWQKKVLILASITLIIVVCHLINIVSSNALSSSFGIIPRRIDRLLGILCSPWLHADWGHLWANLPILLILSALILWESIENYIKVSLFIILCAGLLLWLFGRPSNHIGASVYIFGLWSYLISRSYFQHNLKNFIISALVLFLYGGIVWGFLPKEGISFEGHISGAISGILYAYVQHWYHTQKK